jgi:hypothetical protein
MARHAVELGAAIWQAQEHYRRGPGSPLPWNDQEAFRFASAFGEHLGQLPKNWIQSSPVLKGIMKVARDPGLRGAGDGLFQVLALLPNRVVKVKNDESIQFVACEGLSPDAYQRTMESLLSIFPKINWPPGITSQESGSQIRAQANLRPLGINLDLRNRKIDRNSFPPLDLSNRTTEWQLFILLAENVGNLVYFEALGRVVGGDTPGHRPNLQSHISHLRFKIKKLGGEILPSRNLGYRLHFK